ncbi:hypothetical protein L9F63_025643, partial [Diploptera punctata]
FSKASHQIFFTKYWKQSLAESDPDVVSCMSANRIHKAATPTEYPYQQHCLLFILVLIIYSNEIICMPSSNNWTENTRDVLKVNPVRQCLRAAGTDAHLAARSLHLTTNRR